MPKIEDITEPPQIVRCLPVMRVLRPHLEPDDDHVTRRIMRQMAQGYRLLAMTEDSTVLALAGFRFQENLLFGRCFYVDDLVVAPHARRQGHAEALLEAVRAMALADGLDFVTLDTAISNEAAQQLYARCGYEKLAYHLVLRLPG